jgi:menaquinone-dependent protoporphyrinogen oxidase
MSEGITRSRFIRGGALAVLAVATPVGVKLAVEQPKVEHPSVKMGTGAQRVLVVYGTKSGCTAGVAQRIGRTCAASNLAVDVVPAESAGSPADYAAVIVGSGIRMSHWHGTARTWVTSHADVLKTKPLALYTVCMTLASDPSKTDVVRAYSDSLIAETGVKPVDIGLFKGRNTGEGFSLVERWVLAALNTPKGDFREWPAIDGWTKTTLPRLVG